VEDKQNKHQNPHRLMTEAEENINMHTGRRLYSIPETYMLFYKAMRTIRYMSKSRKKNELSLEFMIRLLMNCLLLYLRSIMQTPGENLHRLPGNVLLKSTDNLKRRASWVRSVLLCWQMRMEFPGAPF